MKSLFKYLILIPLAFSCAKETPEPTPEPTPDPPKDIPVESLTIVPSSIELTMGTTDSVKVVVLPENATDKSYTLRSTNSTVFTVSETGVITPKSVGTGKIIAFQGNIKDTCDVTVKKSDIIYSKKLKLNPTSKVIGLGSEFVFTLTRVPVKANDPVVWSSDDESIVTVDATGKVKALSTGDTKIHVKAPNCEVEAAVSVCEEFRAVRVDALTRIENTTDYFDETEPVRVARGETAAMQFCLDAFRDISEISAELVYFGSAGRTVIEPKIYWERKITCSRHWDAWAGGAADDEIFTNNDEYLDPLMPLDYWNPAPVKSSGRAVAWCEFDIPRDFAPGTYGGEFKFDFKYDDGGAQQTKSMSKAFDVQVYSATLPEKQGLNVINWETGSFAQMNNGQEVEYHSSWPPLMTVLIEFMNDYGQTAWRTYYASKSNMGGKCKADYTTTPYSIKYDFGSMWTREFELYIDKVRDLRQVHGQQCCMKRENPDKGDEEDILIGSYYLDYDDLDDEDHPKLKYTYCYSRDTDANSVKVKAGFVEYFCQLGDFLKSKQVGDGRTWLDLYAQTIVDEPKDPIADSYTTVGRLIHQGCPDMKVTDAIETNNIAADALDYPCPTLKFIDQCPAKEGQEQWMYTCMSPQGNYANRFIRIPLIKTRFVHWCNYYYDAPNYLHWGLKYWEGAKNGDPYGDVCGQFIGGDSYIIYPDANRKVFPSIRLCAMRDGIRDYDLLKMVEARDPVKANEFLGLVVKGTANYDTDVANFRETRKQMLEYLSD